MTTDLFADPADIEPIRPPLTPEQADKLPHIHRLLLGHYGQPAPREPWDPLTQLIYSLLSARTKTPVSHQVMRDLERTFHAGPGNWEPVRDASVAEIASSAQPSISSTPPVGAASPSETPRSASR